MEAKEERTFVKLSEAALRAGTVPSQAEFNRARATMLEQFGGGNEEEVVQEPGSILAQVQTNTLEDTNNKSKLVQMRFQPRTIESISIVNQKIDSLFKLIKMARGGMLFTLGTW